MLSQPVSAASARAISVNLMKSLPRVILIRLHARLAHDFTPLRDLPLDVSGEFLRCAGKRVGAGRGELLLELRRMHDLHKLRIESRDDRSWRSCGRKHAVPRRDFEI